MKSKCTRALLVLCFATVVYCIWASNGEWKTFFSERHGYSVQYPATWHLFETSLKGRPDSLDILNFPVSQRVEGVVLREGGAEISIGSAENSGITIDEWNREKTKADEVKTKRELEVAKPSASGCRRLVEVTSLFEVGPGRNYSRTIYYCQTGKRLYGIFLTNWQGDPKENDFRKVALEITNSLRTVDTKN